MSTIKKGFKKIKMDKDYPLTNNPQPNQFPQEDPNSISFSPVVEETNANPSQDNPQETLDTQLGQQPQIITSEPPKKGFGGKKLVATILGILLIAGGLGAGLILVQRQQDIREKAATEGDRQCVTAYNCLDKKTKCCPGLVEINDKSCDRKDEQKRQIRCVPNIGDGGGGTPTPPPGGNLCPGKQVVWCATFSCPNGDTDGDGTCNPTPHNGYSGDAGASFTTATGTNCPSVACGQIDYYSAGPEGQNWDAYCGHTMLGGFPNCGGGGGGEGGEEEGTPPPGPTLNAQCKEIRIFDLNWKRIKGDALSQLKAGDKVYLTVAGVTNMGRFEKAKFKINGEVTKGTDLKKPDSPARFYMEWTIPEGVTTFRIDANLKHSDIGWLENW